MRSQNPQFSAPQTGVALVIGLMLVIVFALIGVTAMNTTRLQEQMAGNMQSYLLAFNASESALRAGEQALNDADCPVTTAPGITIYDVEAVSVDDGITDVESFWYDRAWPTNIGVAVDYNFSGAQYANLAQQPRYLIEDVPNTGSGANNLVIETHGGNSGSGNTDIIYEKLRITARAVGGTGNEFVATQSTYIVDCI